MSERVFDVIGLDADDTLWHSEDSFAEVEARFVELVAAYAPDGVDVAAALRATESAQLPVAGYGVKAFTLSMVRAALTVTEDRVPQAVIGQLLDAGIGMLTEQVRLLPHVPEVLADLSRDHQLVLITKGDLVHQMRKVTTSGLAHHFHHVEVVLEKDAETYARILDVIGVPAARFCMVGNSVRSDILPVLALGAHAVHIPYPLLWEHEHIDHDEDLDELASILELPAALRDAHVRTIATVDDDGRLAARAIDELLADLVDVEPFGGSVHLHCTDVEGEWIVRPQEGGGHVVAREHAKGDAAIRGPAHHLLMVLRHLQPLDTVEVIGDRTVAERFVDRAPRG